ncbi:hypothetical protein U5N28_19320 [Lysinibacillus telephonicus]|uniref:Uncharacterized protein n=1 Tax=Lysinibacillus telephonicus TaxID=1714840 RepID=A0A431UBP1_9BACI|nr:hypothetical protein [Lysinibacillus telephonicus]RTQ86193.1 hypothetical protein EKG35_20350 [Lysinibacillus telephonicus]
MIRKLLLTLVLSALVLIFVYPQRDTIISVFSMTDEPLVISKGNYGQSLIVEVSFTHEGFPEWLQSLKQPYPLLMLDADWINRSPKIVDIIKERNIPTGLLGGNGAEEYSIEAFNKDLAIYQKHFENKPLWFMTSDYEFGADLQQAVFKEEINLLSPSIILTNEKYKKINGALVSWKLNEQSKPKFEDVTKLIKKQKFISIEENIFGYTIKTKKTP